MEAKSLDAVLKPLRTRRRLRGLLALTGANVSKEQIYRDLLIDGARGEGIPLPALYPVGAAANYSLLYVLFRLATELPIRRVLELGAGQSTLVFDAVAKAQGIAIDTVEDNEEWAQRVSARVTHDVTLAPLVDRSFNHVTAKSYSGIENMPTDVDLLVVDGPAGEPRSSRWGALEIADRCLAQEFIVVFDDAERDGEQDTIREFFKAVRPGARVHSVSGVKAQIIAFTEAYRGAAYL